MRRSLWKCRPVKRARSLCLPPRCDEEWYLEADRTEKNLPAVRLNSAQTDETVAMAALESDGEIADAIYENGLFYIAVTQPAEKEETAD